MCLAVLGLAGCATADAGTGAEPYPANYKQIVKTYIRDNFKDPDSVRDAEIAAPLPSKGPSLLPVTGEFTSGYWVVCLKTNAKNSFGAYTGKTEMALLVRRGQVANMWDKMTFLACEGAKYEPFAL
jgi:hypothetical protein